MHSHISVEVPDLAGGEVSGVGVVQGVGVIRDVVLEPGQNMLTPSWSHPSQLAVVTTILLSSTDPDSAVHSWLDASQLGLEAGQ